MKFSIIVPIYKEKNIMEKIDNLTHQLKSVDYEIIVVEGKDGCEGSSTDHIRNEKASVYLLTSPKGRGIQLQEGVVSATGDLLIFLHYDTKLDSKQIEDILKNYEKFDYGAFRLKIDGDRFLYRLIEFFVFLRSIVFKLPYGDQTIFIKKDILNRIGGIKNIPLFEDVELMMRCKRYKLRFYLSPLLSITSDRRWRRKGVILNTIKNLFILILYFIGVKEEKLYRIYYGN